MRACLTVESGLASPPSLELDDAAPVQLGRNRHNNVVLHDRHASRRHAELFCRDGRWFVRDHGTTNGTRLDGAPIRGETPLENGQVIGIGEVRLRFAHEAPAVADPGTLPVVEVEEQRDTTFLQMDELSALFRFMNRSLGETTPPRLVEIALDTAVRQTGAQVAGFLSLDEAPELRLVLPTQAVVDGQLSRQLTQQVQRRGELVWLGAPENRALESDSLASFHDAVCIPLRGPGEPPLGALHVYKAARPFLEREVRFLEVLAGSLAAALHVLRGRRALEADNSRLRERTATAGDELVGSSAAMSQVRQQVRRLADVPCTVLIFGESGVGKELVALGLHRHSRRSKGPLVIVNCAAISGGLAESELFGHVKGAFSGAVRDHPGYFSQADMGTLFLDELGELSLDLQAKLLRAIETKCFRPVGARADQRADVRIIAATNRDLEKEAQEGRFRRDLFFRLTSRVVVPPLRDHLEDVPELAGHFLAHLNSEYRRDVSLSDAALARLMSYSWPGNVRQLRGVLEAAVAMAEGEEIRAGELYLPDEKRLAEAERPGSLNLEALEEWAIRRALEQTGHNNTQAARLLGIHRDTLINKLRKYRIEKNG